jgi:hypothetical protein
MYNSKARAAVSRGSAPASCIAEGAAERCFSLPGREQCRGGSAVPRLCELCRCRSDAPRIRELCLGGSDAPCHRRGELCRGSSEVPGLPPRMVLKLERCAPPLRAMPRQERWAPAPASCAEAGALCHGAPPPRDGAPAGSHEGVKAGGRVWPSTGALEFRVTRKVSR